MGKRGAKAKHYVSHDGETIVGLRRDDKSQRFFPVGRGSPSFGADEAKAIHRFRLWQAQQTDGEPIDDDGGIHHGPTLEGKIYWAAHFRNLIYSDPRRAATELDCEPLRLLANVENLKPPPPSKRLADLCDCYLADRSLSSKEATNSRTWWNEFVKITKATTVMDLDRESFRLYRETIQKRQGKKSNVYVRSRFGKIKTIIKHASVEMDLTPAERLVLSHALLLKQPSKPTPKPIDIDPQEMRAILENSDEWNTALFLLALNAAYTNKDCQRLEWSMVDFDKGTIYFERDKTRHLSKSSVPRLCALWNRTIDALTKLRNGHSNVFVSVQGLPAHIDTMNDHFIQSRKRAGIHKDLTFKHLRKSALTAAANDPTVPDRQINLLAGHSAGIKDHYVVRKNVQLACEAIERYYFGIG